VDLFNLRFGGGAHCEGALADHIATLDAGVPLTL